MSLSVTKKNKNATALSGTIFFGLFLLLGLAALAIFLNQMIRSANYIETNALISNIQTTYTKGDTSHDVFVDFVVNGITYTHVELNYYESSMDLGEIIKIKYNPNNPVDIIAGSPSYFIGIIVCCVLFVGIGVYGIIMSIRKYRKSKIRNVESPVVVVEEPQNGLLMDITEDNNDLIK